MIKNKSDAWAPRRDALTANGRGQKRKRGLGVNRLESTWPTWGYKTAHDQPGKLRREGP